MRIIKEGKLPEDREHEFSCNQCGTVFVAKEYECQTWSSCRGESGFKYPCPLCKKECWINR